MVAGVGGGGGNAVKHLYSMEEVEGVNFMLLNTDKQALERNPIPTKIQLGDGLGAGNNPEKAKEAALNSESDIRAELENHRTKMLFITAGMGGGTGTGASPVLARIAKEMGILTVGIVSIPYRGEGPKRVRQAVKGIEELLPHVDSLIVINNEHIAQIHGRLSIKEAHAKADDILAMAAKSISDIITKNMDVNVDFADVTTVMRDEENSDTNAKIALMGSFTGSATAAEGESNENLVLRIAEAAVNSPLLHHNDIRGARKVLLNISWGDVDVSYEEATQVLDFIQSRSGFNSESTDTDVIWGAGKDENLGNDIRITIVATGYDVSHIPAISEYFDPLLTGIKKPVENRPHREVIPIDDAESATARNKRPNNFEDDEFGVRGGEGSSNDGYHHSNGSTIGGGYSSSSEARNPQRIEVTTNLRGGVADSSNQTAAAGGADQSGGKPVVSTQMDSLVDGEIEQKLVEPAYLRRGIKLDYIARGAGSVRESLEDSGSSSRSRNNEEKNTTSLFDE